MSFHKAILLGLMLLLFSMAWMVLPWMRGLHAPSALFGAFVCGGTMAYAYLIKPEPTKDQP